MSEQFRVLVVDDNEDLAVTIQDILHETGYEAAAVFDGKSAMDACAGKSFDLLLIDIRLPDMDGLLLQERLAETTDADCIIITGHAHEEDAAKMLKRKRIVGVEIKPLDMRRLLASIEKIKERG